jgi:hypothetical protein
MRLLQVSLIAAALVTSATAGYAQSAYDYPWCALYAGKRGGQSCYFTSWAQCMQTLSGIGGSCIESPYYRGGRHDDRRRWGDRKGY